MIRIMDMQGIYKDMDFYREYQYTISDCTQIEGTNCYCDDEARHILRQLIEGDTAKIRFSDSGNYHYLTAIYLEMIREPFSLIVFDHHPDMQLSAFSEILSCGGWVCDVLQNNKYIQDVIIIGVKDELIELADERLRDRVRFIKESELETGIKEIQKLKSEYPIYISVDKDVMDTESVITNWDQGSLTIDEQIRCLEALIDNNSIIGADVCGELMAENGIYNDADAIKNNECNKKILKALYSAFI